MDLLADGTASAAGAMGAATEAAGPRCGLKPPSSSVGNAADLHDCGLAGHSGMDELAAFVQTA